MGNLANKTLVMIAKETTYGTAVEGSIVIPVESVEVEEGPEMIDRSNDKVGDLFGLTAIPGRKTFKITMKGKLYPTDGLGQVLAMILNTPTTTTGVPAVGANTHILDLIEANIAQRSLTVEVFTGGYTSDKYAGFMAASIKINGNNKDVIAWEIVGVAQDRSAGNALSAETFTVTAENPYRHSNAKVYWDSVQVNVDSWSYELDLTLKLDNFKQADIIEKPVLNGRPVVKSSITRDFVDRAARTLFEAGTTKDLTKHWGIGIGYSNGLEIMLSAPISPLIDTYFHVNDNNFGLGLMVRF